MSEIEKFAAIFNNRGHSASTMTRRMLAGFCAAVVSTLTFHQAMWGLLFSVGLMPPPFPMAGTRFGIPLIVSICLWRGVWGAAFGAVSRFGQATWRSGLLFGILVGACEWLSALVRSRQWPPTRHSYLYLAEALLVNGFWGLGLGIILTALFARARGNGRRRG